jgi:hypothetical protein
MHFPCWDSQASPESSLLFLKEQASAHLALCVSRQSLVVKDLLSQDDWLGLVEFDIDYADVDLSAFELIHLRQALAFFQKNKALPLSINREQVAFSKFEAAEAQCRLTNECFKAWSEGRFQFRPLVEHVLHIAQRKISEILGPLPSWSDVDPRFGPGATIDTKRSVANPRLKISAGFSCSENLLPFVPPILRSLPHLLEFHGKMVRSDPPDDFSEEGYEVYSVPITLSGGRLSFVAKSAKTDRAIVVEPSLNAMFQMAYGDYIARRLRRQGIDIRDQTYN